MCGLSNRERWYRGQEVTLPTVSKTGVEVVPVKGFSKVKRELMTPGRKRVEEEAGSALFGLVCRLNSTVLPTVVETACSRRESAREFVSTMQRGTSICPKKRFFQMLRRWYKGPHNPWKLDDVKCREGKGGILLPVKRSLFGTLVVDFSDDLI